MTPAEQVKSKIAELESALLTAHPTMPVLLRDIHTHLKNDASVVTLLSETDIGVIVRGLKVQTNTEIATAAAKGKGGKAIKNIGLDDL